MKTSALKPALLLFTLLALAATFAWAQDAQTTMTDEEKIADALSAGPVSVTQDATIMDWPSEAGGEMRVLREGSNDWICHVSSPAAVASGYRDPMCLDEAWQGWLEALISQNEPTVEHTGIGYMFAGDGGNDNIAPGATGPTPENEWHVSGPHMMILTSDPSELDGVSTDYRNGGPYVMWAETPYAHIMVPLGEHTQ